MIVLSGFKTGVAKFNLEFEDYMIVWSQFQIVVRPFKTVRPRFNVQFLPSFFLLRAEFFGSREMHDRQRLRMFRQEKSMSSESICERLKSHLPMQRTLEETKELERLIKYKLKGGDGIFGEA